MRKYYIERTCGNFSAPIQYAEKSKEEIMSDIIEDYPVYETVARFDTKEEAEKAMNKYYNDISVIKNVDRVIVNYDIYNLDSEEV